MTAIDTPTTIQIDPESWEWVSEALADDNPDATVRVHDEREVCPTCAGRGTTWHGWGAADACTYTASEWHELDDDDRDGYMSGRYDKTCPECHGANVVTVLTVSADADVITEIEDYLRSSAELAAAEAQERRMGC